MSIDTLRHNWRRLTLVVWVVAAGSLTIGLVLGIGGLYSLVPLFFIVLGLWLHQKTGS